MQRPVMRSELSSQIARRLVEMMRSGALPVGSHLREQMIASQFGVSRSPVREALHVLAGKGIVIHVPNRGFFTADDSSMDGADGMAPDVGPDESYRTIAAERLAGRLPDRFTAADLGRRYDLNRAEVTKIIGRMAEEGWIERLPGYGWTFVQVLTTPESFALSYRARLVIEPAALLEPTYSIDREAFARCRVQQTALAEGQMKTVSSVELFAIGSHFHEVIVACCGNPFLIDPLKRINRLRRLLEYRAMVDTTKFLEQARDHLQILDRLEGGDRVGAAELLRRHLEVVREVKLDVLTSEHAPDEEALKFPPVLSVHLHF